ncbi:ribosome biogenesis GTPase Der [Candidatus Saccharibacteria bacterium]|nr:ribosome biogenesis GTPase Der [Candidatus Saccharibacteria bacterium]
MKSLPKVAIVGLPNVGKSTLFNRLTHSNQAVISDTAHTTRDLNRGVAEWQNQQFEVIDTAGYTKPDGEIKIAAMEQLEKTLGEVDLVLLLVDGTVEPGQADQTLAKTVHKTGKPKVLAINKAESDKKLVSQDRFNRLGFDVEFKVSALNGQGTGDLLDYIASKIPKAKKAEKPTIQVAILGRPNVGKSSLLNALAGNKLAITSSTAGTTRDVNNFELTYHSQKIHYFDTAGLRKPGKIGRDIEYYSSLRSKKAVEQADICLALIDANEPATAQDQHILGIVKEAKKGLIVVVTKWDSVQDKDSTTMARLSRVIAKRLQFVWWAPLIFTSAHEKQNLNQLQDMILDIHKRLDFKLTTSTLNKFLAEANAKQPPVAVKTRRPKVNYITQTGTRPPIFTIFATHPKLMHWSYTRFLENRLRSGYDLNGVPITIEYKSKYKEAK